MSIKKAIEYLYLIFKTGVRFLILLSDIVPDIISDILWVVDSRKTAILLVLLALSFRIAKKLLDKI